MGKEKYNRSMFDNFIIYMIRIFVNAVLPLIIFPYASRILGADGIGRVTYAQSISSYFQTFAGMGIATYGIREGARFRNNPHMLGKLAFELFLINAVSATVSCSLYFIIVFTNKSLKGYRDLLIAFSILIGLEAFNFEWILCVKENYFYITVRSFLIRLFTLVYMLLFLKKPSDYLTYAVVLILPTVGDKVFNFIYVFRDISWRSRKSLELRRHIKSLIFVFGVILSATIYTLLDTTMLGMMRGDEETGLYAASMNVCRMVVKLITGVCTVFTARLSYYISEGEKEKYRNLADISLNMILIIAIPIAALLLFFPENIITVFSGDSFLEAAISMRIAAVDLLLASLSGFVGWQILLPNKKEKRFLTATCLGAVIDILLNFLLIPIWHVEGATIATVIAELCVLSCCLVGCREDFALLSVAKNLLLYIGAALWIIVIKLFIHFESSLLTLIVASGLFAILYALTLLIGKNKYVIAAIERIKTRIR